MFRYFTKISITSRFSVRPSITEPSNISNFLEQREVTLLSLMKKHETLSSVNNFYSILRQNNLKHFFYQRELSFFLCLKLFQQLKISKYAPFFSQFPQNFKVNEQQISTKQKFLSSKENLRHAKLQYFFGEIPSFDRPKFGDESKIFKSTAKVFKAKNMFVDGFSDKITLLFDKLNNSLVKILLEIIKGL